MLKKELCEVKAEKQPVMFKMNLQLFADSGEDNSGDDTDEGPESVEDDVEDDVEDEEEKESLTKEQLKKLLKSENKKGQREILSKLGITSPRNADVLFNDIKEFLKGRKTPEQIKAENESQAAVQQAEERAMMAEAKVSALKAGAKPDCLDDLIILASSRIEDGTEELDDIFVELKKKYPVLFVSGDGNGGENNNSGTGKPIGSGKGGDDNTPSLGARLAKSKAATSKSNFFKMT